VNSVTRKRGSPIRSVMQSVLGVDKNAPLPEFVSSTFLNEFQPDPVSQQGKRVVLFVTCFANNNRPSLGHATVKLLRAAGIGVEASFPACCGMPQLESGLVGEVALKAKKISAELISFVDRGCQVVALTPSCALMLRQEWPLLVPGDAMVQRVSDATVDASEFIATLIKDGSLKKPKKSSEEAVVTLHSACHTRAQNVGLKSREILAAIPDVKVKVIDRCSGHGGTWGFENYETAKKVGAPVFARAKQDEEEAQASKAKHFVTSDCPLAAKHILDGQNTASEKAEMHPIEIFAKFYFD
jgi:glycerol-3-phosphate dehydrogenase subunit C